MESPLLLPPHDGQDLALPPLYGGHDAGAMQDNAIGQTAPGRSTEPSEIAEITGPVPGEESTNGTAPPVESEVVGGAEPAKHTTVGGISPASAPGLAGAPSTTEQATLEEQIAVGSAPVAPLAVLATGPLVAPATDPLVVPAPATDPLVAPAPATGPLVVPAPATGPLVAQDSQVAPSVPGAVPSAAPIKASLEPLTQSPDLAPVANTDSIPAETATAPGDGRMIDTLRQLHQQAFNHDGSAPTAAPITLSPKQDLTDVAENALPIELLPPTVAPGPIPPELMGGGPVPSTSTGAATEPRTGGLTTHDFTDGLLGNVIIAKRKRKKAATKKRSGSNGNQRAKKAKQSSPNTNHDTMLNRHSGNGLRAQPRGPLEVAIPPNFFPGDKLTVEDPRDLKKYLVTIPPNAREGSVLHVDVQMLQQHQLGDGPKVMKPTVKPHPHVPRPESIPPGSTSSMQAFIDFRYEEMRLRHLTKLLESHGHRLDGDHIMHAIKQSCPNAQRCMLDEIGCVPVPTQARIDFFLNGPSKTYLKTRGGHKGFADLMSTILAHDLSILESPQNAKRRCHLLPPAVGSNKALLVDIKTYLILKLITIEGGAYRLVSMQQLVPAGNEASPPVGYPSQGRGGVNNHAAVNAAQLHQMNEILSMLSQERRKVMELEHHLKFLSHENQVLKMQMQQQQYEMAYRPPHGYHQQKMAPQQHGQVYQDARPRGQNRPPQQDHGMHVGHQNSAQGSTHGDYMNYLRPGEL